MTGDVIPIALKEMEARIEKAQRLLTGNKIKALVLDASVLSGSIGIEERARFFIPGTLQHFIFRKHFEIQTCLLTLCFKVLLKVKNMTQVENLTKRPLFTPALGKRMLTGAGIALVMISFFIISAGKGSPGWGDYWRIKPLLLTPCLGAITGLCYDVTEPLRRLSGWLGRLFLLVSLLGYFIGLWISLVLGLNGTMWN